MFETIDNLGFETCRHSTTASTTASNSDRTENNLLKPYIPDDFFQGDVIADWLSFRHDFQVGEPTNAIESGRTVKISIDGEIEWEKHDFNDIRCPSSDTSVRIKCDGKHLWFSGNIGRFSMPDNETGLPVIQCFEKARELIKNIYPQIDTRLLGSRHRIGSASEYGTHLTRVDLASNFLTSDYLHLSQVLAQRKLGQRTAKDGRWGPTWGYDTKRCQYWNAKLYDKLAELLGMRSVHSGETLARFEVKLGSQFLKQKQLDQLINWSHEMKTENVIYGKFANQIFREQATLDDFALLPPKMRQHAVLWRDGTDPRTYLKKSQYYSVAKQLREFGLDISKPSNLVCLQHRVKVVEVFYANTLRKAS